MCGRDSAIKRGLNVLTTVSNRIHGSSHSVMDQNDQAVFTCQIKKLDERRSSRRLSKHDYIGFTLNIIKMLIRHQPRQEHVVSANAKGFYAYALVRDLLI